MACVVLGVRGAWGAMAGWMGWPFVGHTGCDERPYRVNQNHAVHAVWCANMVCIGVDRV